MIQNDTLMRQVQQLAEVLSQVLFNKRNEQYDEALAQIRTSSQQLLNLDITEVKQLTFDELWKSLHQAGGIDPHHAGLVAELLKHQGDIHLIEERTELGLRSYELALHLYLMLHDHPGSGMDYSGRIDPLLEHVSAADLEPYTQRLLFRYLRDQHRLDLAEDVLFFWAEHSPEEALEEGIAFYENLLSKQDGELEKGGLPRDEVQAGMEDLRALTA